MAQNCNREFFVFRHQPPTLANRCHQAFFPTRARLCNKTRNVIVPAIRAFKTWVAAAAIMQLVFGYAQAKAGSIQGLELRNARQR
jgi:hypothetical protein